MGNKIGRPKKVDAKDVTFKIRLSQDDYDRLSKCAKLNSKSRAEIIRDSLRLYYLMLLIKENSIELGQPNQ